MSEPKFDQMDYLFCPEELSKVAFFDSRKIEEAYEIGYRKAKEEISLMQKAVGWRSRKP